ncbi:MAG: GNAT family protein [Deltaproteobacteria bacterium]
MFEDYPREVVTKDGTPILIRPLAQEDEQRLIDFIARLPQEERWFLRHKMDDPEVVRQWMEKLDFKLVIPMVAVKQEDQMIIANVRLHRRASACMEHLAHLRIMVDPGYRHQRVGTWMLLDVIRLAMALGLEKLVAEFVAGMEEAGINAAHRLDFFEEAVLRDYVKDPQGNYRDLIIMVKKLHRDWSDF